MGDQFSIWVGTTKDLESQLPPIYKYSVSDAFGLKSCVFLRNGLNFLQSRVQFFIAGSPQTTTYNNEGDVGRAFNENVSYVY